MSSYLNAYEILKQVRMSIDEYDEDIVQGVTTVTAINNNYIMSKINEAQRYIYASLVKRIPDKFLTSLAITFSGSVANLPWDYAFIDELKDENGYKVHHIKMKLKTPVVTTGSSNFYYQKGRQLFLDKDGITATYTLLYTTKPRDIDQGRITATGTNTITLDSSAKKIDDYYNGMIIENIHSDYIDTITDYTSDRIATVSNAAEIEDVYGIVPEIPEPFHFLIPLKATLDIKSQHPLVKEKANTIDYTAFEEMFRETLFAFASPAEDISIDEVLTQYDQIL